jgi:predicted nucleic acid-binding protein
MDDADGWFICRVGFLEVSRALSVAAGQSAVRRFREERSAFAIVEVDQKLLEHASALAVKRKLRSLDALHLASALLLAPTESVLATWDRRLHAAGLAERLSLLPASL